MLITLLQPSWQNLCYSAWITQHQLIEMELNIGTFAIVLARHGAPASESAKPLLADGCLPHNQRFLIACLRLIWHLFLICCLILIGKVCCQIMILVAFWLFICAWLWQGFSGDNSDVSPDSDRFSMKINILSNPCCLNSCCLICTWFWLARSFWAILVTKHVNHWQGLLYWLHLCPKRLK